MTISWLQVAGLAAFAFAFSLAAVLAMTATGFALAADVPNDRSMHDRVIPRGGGLGFVAATLAVWAVLGLFELQSGEWVWYIVPFAVMSLLGWLDDHHGLGIATRFAVQVGAAVLVAFFLLESGEGREFGLAYVAWFAAIVLVTVWYTNLYNFMDGMDGLAAGHAVIVLTTMAAWFAAAGASGSSLACAVLASAVAGFLVVNWHPARVFMGDTGSLALGVVIAALSLDGVMRHDLPAAAMLMLMGVFLFDATFTLLRRFLRGERWWQSHRSHLYQRAQALGLSQPRIVGAVIVMDIVLAVCATLVVLELAPWPPLVLAAAVILIAPAWWITRRERRMPVQAR